MNTLYVDDVRQITGRMRAGVRFSIEEKKFIEREEWIEEDLERDRVGGITRRMEEECRLAKNSINPDVQFTTETADEFPEKRLHTLDTDVWLENGKIRHSYYQKSMKTPYVIMQKSAMSGQQKYSILSNELIRRLSNVDPDIDQAEKLEIIEKFIREMKTSGYERQSTREAVVSGIKGHKTKMEKKIAKGGTFYKSGQETLPDRIKKKLLESTTWFREEEEDKDGRDQQEYTSDIWEGNNGVKRRKTRRFGGGNNSKKTKGGPSKIKAVVFVPYTTNSLLAKRMREEEIVLEKMTGYRLKVVERGGTKLEDILVKKNMWEGEECGRQKCLLCRTKSREEKPSKKSCTKRNSVYRTWCNTCYERDRGILRKKNP